MHTQIESLESVSSAIRTGRKAAGLSQGELAKRCDLSQSMISRLEGDIKKLNPSYAVVYDVFCRLSDAIASSDKQSMLMKTAAEVMHRNVVVLDVHDSIDKAIRIIKNHDFAYIPVIDGTGAVVGTVYQKDLLDIATQKTGTVSKIEVNSIIAPPLPQIDGNTRVASIKPLLEAFGSVLVMRRGRLIGIITAYDVLQLF